MNKEHKKLIITAIIVVIITGAMGYFCYDATEQRAAAKQALLTEEAALSGMMFKVRKIPQLKQGIDDLKDDIAFYERSLPSDKEAEETLKLLQTLLVQTDISIKSLTPSTASKGRRRVVRAAGPYTKHEFKLSLSGDYHQIARFISGLEHLQRFTSIENMSLKKDAKKGLSVNMTVVTYSFKGAKI